VNLQLAVGTEVGNQAIAHDDQRGSDVDQQAVLLEGIGTKINRVATYCRHR
jgi:hypothetical protein